MAGKLKITLMKSRIGRMPKQRQVLDGLGLKRRHQVVVREDTAAIRGMLKKIDFMLHVEEC
ncbi:MAG TPA: 50S ribosomal protein L30 [Myxococcota bacterium]|nr:50S ribosomal protein L30 [Myxococcota bacterium]